jgi:biopolymer transport protein ExbD
MSSRRHSPVAGTEITLPITPMLDMSFQLLFFFISTFKLPTGMEGSLDLSLPSEATAQADAIQNVDPSKSSDNDKPADLKDVITISVQTATQGTGTDDSINNLILEETAGKTTISPPYKKHLDELTDKLREGIALKADDIHTKAVDEIANRVKQGALTGEQAAVLQRAVESSYPKLKNKDKLDDSERAALGELNASPTVKVSGDSHVRWRGIVKVMDAARSAGLQNISFAQPPDYTTYGH